MHSYWISNCSGLVTLDGLSSTLTLVTLMADMVGCCGPQQMGGGWCGRTRGLGRSPPGSRFASDDEGERSRAGGQQAAQNFKYWSGGAPPRACANAQRVAATV